MTVPALPTEMVAHVLNQLSERDLRVASRVCKAWYFLALPRLYRTVLLQKDSHLKEFRRIIAGDEDMTSPISAYIHNLHFQPYLTVRVSGLSLLSLVPYVSRLSHLQKLFWELFFVPKNLELVKALQTQCPLLKEVTVVVPNSLDIRSKNGRSSYETLLAFKNLTSFTLVLCCRQTGARDVELLDPLKTLTADSPMLEYLVLDFKLIPMTLEHVISSLNLGAEFILPCLESFRLYGCLDEDPDDVGLPRPLGSGVDQFLAFLSLHPHLYELTLNCPFYLEFYDDFNPGVLAQELPKLMLLSGPYFLCEQALRYPIAKGIMTLCISNWEPSLLDESLTDELHLSMLGHLKIEVEDVPRAIEILESISLAAKGLAGLSFPAVHHIYHKDFLEALAQLPNLQYVYLRPKDSHLDDEDAPVPSGFNQTELVAMMQDMFPKIKVDCLGGLSWD